MRGGLTALFEKFHGLVRGALMARGDWYGYLPYNDGEMQLMAGSTVRAIVKFINL
jgi:hypothetical protein